MLSFVIQRILETEDAHIAQVQSATADRVIREFDREVIKAWPVVVPHYVVRAYAEHARKIVNRVHSVRPARGNLNRLAPLPLSDVRLGLHEVADYLVREQRIIPEIS